MAEIALLYIINEYELSLSFLQKVLLGVSLYLYQNAALNLDRITRLRNRCVLRLPRFTRPKDQAGASDPSEPPRHLPYFKS